MIVLMCTEYILLGMQICLMGNDALPQGDCGYASWVLMIFLMGADDLSHKY